MTFACAGDNPMSGFRRSIRSRFEVGLTQMLSDVAGDLVQRSLWRRLIRHPRGADAIETEGAAAVTQSAPSHQIPVLLCARETERLDEPPFGALSGAVDVVELEHAPLGDRHFHGSHDRRFV